MRSLWSVVLVCLSSSSSFATAAAQSSATIYADGRVVVRRVVPARVLPGVFTLAVPLREPDPSTLIALDSGVDVLRVRYPGTESDESLLQRAIGRWIVFLRPNGDTVSARVVSADPLRLELGSGGIALEPLGQAIFPRDLTASRDSVVITGETSRRLERFRFGYQTTGASWSARYAIRLGSPTAAISGSAILGSTSIDLDSAEVHLYAGQVGLPPPAARPRGAYRLEEVVVSGVATRSLGNAIATVEAVSENLGSHRVYSLPGRYQLVSGQTVSVPLFQPLLVPVERIHLIEANGPIGPVAPGTPGQEVPIQIQFRAERPKGSEFGERALPGGIVSIYDGGPGRETLVGLGRIGHASPNAPFLVNTGYALDVHAIRSSSGYQMVQDSTLKPNGSIIVRATAQVQSFDWVVRNAGDSAITAELVERRPGKWRVVQSTIAPDSTDGGVRFRAVVPARGEIKLSYRLRIDQ